MKTYGVLNIVSHPHPEGAYRRLFEKLQESRRAVKFHGERFAAVSPISETRDGVFTGRLATWTRINEEENTIDLNDFEERDFTESGVTIPDSIGFNSRIFPFAFNEGSHTLVIETENDEGQSLSINLAQRAFSRLFQSLSDNEVDSIDVFVVKKNDAIDRILKMPVVRRVQIELQLPNPDDLSEMEEEILKELIEAKAKSDTQVLVKQAGADTLVLTERMRAKANLAKDNGKVIASGREGDDKIELNTDEYPEELYANPEEGGSPLRRLARSR